MESVAFSAAVTGVMPCSLLQSQVRKSICPPKTRGVWQNLQVSLPGCAVSRKHGFRHNRRLRGHACGDEQTSCQALRREVYPSMMQIGAWVVSSLVSISFIWAWKTGLLHGSATPLQRCGSKCFRFGFFGLTTPVIRSRRCCRFEGLCIVPSSEVPVSKTDALAKPRFLDTQILTSASKPSRR